MLYIRVSPNRLFIVNEYWILIPLMLYIDYCIIVRLDKIKARKEDIKKRIVARKKKIENKYKRLKIFALATGSIMGIIAIRGGEEVINYPNCIVEEGIRYVNHERLRKLVHSLYKHKQINVVILIMHTALCYLAESYGIDFPAMPFPIKDFIQISSYYQGIRKAVVTGLPTIDFSDKHDINPNPKILFENMCGGSISKLFKKIKRPSKSVIFYLLVATASLNNSVRTVQVLPQNKTSIIQQKYQPRYINENDNKKTNSVKLKAGNHILTFKNNKKDMEEFVKPISIDHITEDNDIEAKDIQNQIPKKVFKRSKKSLKARTKTLADLPPLESLKADYEEISSELVEQSRYRIQVK